MKTLLHISTLLVLIGISATALAQKVGINTNTPDPSASLEILTTDKGLLIPRVSLSDVADTTSPINNPATGLLIYNTNASTTGGNGAGFYFYNGTAWQHISAADAPALVKDNDSDTKIQVEATPDEDKIRFGVKGYEAMYINNDGKVLIGEERDGYFYVGMGKDVFIDSTDRYCYQSSYQTTNSHIGGSQIFIANHTGYLYQVRFWYANSFYPRVLKIYEGSDTLGSLLYTGPSQLGSIFSINPDIRIQGGMTYTLHLSDVYYVKRGTNRNCYPQGEHYQDGSTTALPDLMFETSIYDTAYQCLLVNEAGVRINNYVLPLADGNANQSMVTDGNRGLFWQNNIPTPEAFPLIEDTDGDTKIQVEKNTDEDQIRFDVNGTQVLMIDNTGNVGIHTTPTGYLNVVTDTSNLNFIVSYNGVSINDYTFPEVDGAANQRITTDGNGNLTWESDPSPSALSLSGDMLNAYGGGSVDLNTIDNQTLTFSSNNLSISNGNTVAITGINTDNQSLSLSGSNLSISNGNTVNLSTINTLSFSGGNLSISNGNSVNLSGINTDAQTLSLSGSNLSISNGNSVSLASFLDNGDWLFSGNNIYNTNTGNVGINKTNPGAKLEVNGNIKLNGTLMLNSGDAVDKIYLTSSGSGGSNIVHTNGWTMNYKAGPGSGSTSIGSHKFYTTDGSRLLKMWITSTGITYFEARASNDDYVMHISNQVTDATTSTRYNGLRITAGKTSNNGANSMFIQFNRAGNNEIGKVAQDNSTSVTYASSSDIRRKTNIVPTKYGITDLMKIQVSDYVFKDEPDAMKTGFIAQQLYTVYPDPVLVGGENVDTDPWMVDYRMMTPLLVKSMQDEQNQMDNEQQQLEQTLNEQELILAQQLEVLKTLSQRLNALENGK